MPFSDTVKRVMDLADAIRDYWDVELRKWHPKYPIVGDEGEYTGPPPPEEAELFDLLRSLAPEDRDKLVALVAVGRGDGPASDFWIMCRDLARQRPAVEEALATLIAHPFLAADLEDGLKALAAAGIDVDAAQPAPV